MTTRRAALLNLAGVATASTLPLFGQNPPPENHHSQQPVTQPEAQEYRFVFFQPEQLKTLEALTETIIPADQHSPGAKAARVSEYIDVMVADASPAAKSLWNEGLASVERQSTAQFGAPFFQCSPDKQVALLTNFAAHESHPETADDRFFAVLKRATIDGYYTSRIGIYKELEYHGNEALSSYPSCTRSA